MRHPCRLYHGMDRSSWPWLPSGHPDWGGLGLIAKTTGAALITADLLSVLIFPLLALTLLRRGEADSLPVQKQSEA
jgi:hypothetical protein